MTLHGNARTCPHSRLLTVERVLEGWSLARAARPLMSVSGQLPNGVRDAIAARVGEVSAIFPRRRTSAILKRMGLGRLSRLQPPEPPNRYQRHPGELLHADVKRLVRIAGAGQAGPVTIRGRQR